MLICHRKHLYNDLQPYTCLYTECNFSKSTFETRDLWSHHLDLGHRLGPTWEAVQCPLCRNTTKPGKTAVLIHFARHLEEIALAALPAEVESDAELEADSSSDSEIVITTKSGMRELVPRYDESLPRSTACKPLDGRDWESPVERCPGCDDAWRRPIPEMDANHTRLASNMIERLRDESKRADAAYEEWRWRHSHCWRPTSPHPTEALTLEKQKQNNIADRGSSYDSAKEKEDEFSTDVLGSESPALPETLVCNVLNCTQEFSGEFRKGNMARHLRYTHGRGGPRYVCAETSCGRTYRRSDSLLVHYRKYHPWLASAPSTHRFLDSVYREGDLKGKPQLPPHASLYAQTHGLSDSEPYLPEVVLPKVQLPSASYHTQESPAALVGKGKAIAGIDEDHVNDDDHGTGKAVFQSDHTKADPNDTDGTYGPVIYIRKDSWSEAHPNTLRDQKVEWTWYSPDDDLELDGRAGSDPTQSDNEAANAQAF